MSDRIGEDALLDVGCCLNRFEVDSIQGLSWKSHTYLANKSHILPVRLLHSAQIGCTQQDTYVTARDDTRRRINLDGASLQVALAAIKDSDLRYLGLFDPTEDPITEEEITQVAAVAGTVKVADLRLWGQLRHLSPAALHRLMFSFSTSDHFTLQVNGTQLTDEHLHECGRRDIWRLRVTSESADAGSLAISDDGLLDYLFAPGYGTRYRRVVFSAFNASQKFVQKLISRAQLVTNVSAFDLEVQHLPLQSQQLGAVRLFKFRGAAKHVEVFEDGARLTFEFGPNGFHADFWLRP
ncbi:hypothetical protein AAVH_12448 [Aphelenchoides avenae]|nr:hypothetical protein AAVH_12448 [Aphelenchus avenae]